VTPPLHVPGDPGLGGGGGGLPTLPGLGTSTGRGGGADGGGDGNQEGKGGDRGQVMGVRPAGRLAGIQDGVRAEAVCSLGVKGRFTGGEETP